MLPKPVQDSIPPEHDIMKMTADQIIDALNQPWPTSDLSPLEQIDLLLELVEREKREGI
jgi:hypothetical protein